MGKHSNIILIDKSSEKIIDSIKRVSPDMSRIRQVLPGIKYEYPQIGNKLNPLDFSENQFDILLNENSPNTKYINFLH